MSTLIEAPVLGERRGAALWLRLNRPRARNAMNPELIAAQEAALHALELAATTRDTGGGSL